MPTLTNSCTSLNLACETSTIGYRHYPSKDDLIVAYLRQSDALFWRQWEQITAGIETPREQLLAFFGALQEYALTPACHGCPFLNVATEYPQPDYLGHRVALAHKQAVRARFVQLAQAAGAAQPQALADALLLLMDGAYMAARMFDAGTVDPAGHPARHLAEAAGWMLDAHCHS